MLLGFLNLGPSEIVLLLVLLLLLFGLDKLPQMARAAGRARARLDAVQRQFSQSLESDDERLLREQLEFEKLREKQVASQGAPAYAPPPSPEDEARLRQAAEALGIPTAGRTVEELRTAIWRHTEPPR